MNNKTFLCKVINDAQNGQEIQRKNTSVSKYVKNEQFFDFFKTFLCGVIKDVKTQKKSQRKNELMSKKDIFAKIFAIKIRLAAGKSAQSSKITVPNFMTPSQKLERKKVRKTYPPKKGPMSWADITEQQKKNKLPFF